MPAEPNRATRVRVAVLIVENHNILLAEHEKGGRRYWLLPGGGMEFGESVEEAAKRELLEEAGIEIEVGDLLWVVDSIPGDGHRHVLNLIVEGRALTHALTPGQDQVLRDMRWWPVEAIADLEIFPDTREEILRYVSTGNRGVGLLGKRWK